MTEAPAGKPGTVVAVIAIVAVQLMVAALLFGTVLLDRPHPTIRPAAVRRRRR